MLFTRLLRSLQRSSQRNQETQRHHQRSHRKPAPPRRPWLPRLEGLEDRVTPSTFTVTNLLDSGPGSLRAAVTAANTHPGADVVTFQHGLHGTITLTSGQLNVTDSVTINGPSAAQLAVSGNNASRVFDISSGVTATLSGLTISHGRATTGGGIDNAGNLTVSNSTLVNNQSA